MHGHKSSQEPYPPPGPGSADAPTAAGRWGEALLVFVVALGVRLLQPNQPPDFDELYHMLAARSWLDDGTFAIADGVYSRGAAFTLLVAGFMGVLGESWVVARLPSILLGSLWVTVVFLWVRAYAGRTAAVLAALAFAFDPTAVNLSQQVRFYTLHGIAIWVLAIAVFHVAQRRMGPREAGVLLLGLAAGWLAYDLQVITLIGVMALGAWLLAYFLWRTFAGTERDPRFAWGAVAVVGGGVLGIAYYALTGALVPMVERFATAPLWAADRQTDIRWYHEWFRGQYGAFWALFPLAALAAVHRFRAPAAFCVVFFGVAFVLHSLSGSKAERYLFWAYPAFVAVWAMAGAVVIPALFRMGREMVQAALGPRGATAAAVAMVGVAMAFAAYTTPVNYSVRQMLKATDEWRPYPLSDWEAAAPDLRALATEADVVISGVLPKALYYLDRGDVVLGATELADLSPGQALPPEFTNDPRFGRPSISRPESLRRLMDDHATGLVILEPWQWDHECCVTPETSALIRTAMEPIPLDPDWRVMAFRWGSSTSPEPEWHPDG